MVDKPETIRKFNLSLQHFVKYNSYRQAVHCTYVYVKVFTLVSNESHITNSLIHEGRKVLRHFIQANYELVIHVVLLQSCYLIYSQTKEFLMKLRQKKIL